MKKIHYLWLLTLAIFAACKNPAASKVDVVASNIDTTVNPAEDFFRFACGGWINKNPIPDAYSQWGIGNMVQEQIWEQLKAINENAAKNGGDAAQQKIGDFYKAAMDTVSIENTAVNALAKELQLIESITDIKSLTEVAAHLQTIGVPVLFDMSVWQDLKNSDKNRLYLWQGGIGLPNRDYYFNTDARTVKVREEYKNNHIQKIWDLSLTAADRERLKNVKMVSPAAGIYALEEVLAKNSRKLEDLRDPYANYNKLAVADLQKLTPLIDWKLFFEKAAINGIDSVIVGQPEFFKTLNTQLNTLDIQVVKNYLRFHLISEYADYLHQEIRDADFDFYGKLIKGKKEQLPRWKRVLQWEENAMGEELGKLYVKENFDEKSKQRYVDMVKAVSLSYEEHIKQLDWMSDATKDKAIAKLHTITPKVGYPDKWKDFSSLKIVPNSLTDNIKNANRFWFDYSIAKLNKPVDRTEWDMTPQTYNAYYNPSNNEIVLPAAIFTIPGFKDADIDDAVVYGYAGASTIGHEITHGFDDEGRQYDASGNLFNWWQKEDEDKFKVKGDAYVAYFSNMVVLDSLHINGEATLGENIADLGGIAIAIDAFKKTKQYKEGKTIAGYTPLQRFFLGYALGWMMHMREEELASRILTDVHSPYFLRVNGPFSHIDDFYKAFEIKKGDKMWIDESARIKIW
jgi:putative endopeptidase